MKRFSSLVVVAVWVALGAGCARNTDVGKECVPVKALPDGGTAPILPDDIRSSNQDIISFGVVECEDLVCVRAANTPLSPTGQVFGYCSRACAPEGSACPAYDEKLDQDPKTAFSCRSLLLDDVSLKALQNDPAFRDHTNPYFCAQPNQAGDAGN